MEDTTTASVSTSTSVATPAFSFPNVFSLIKDAAIFAYKNFGQLLVLILVPVAILVCIEAGLFLAMRPFPTDAASIAVYSQPQTSVLFLVFGALFLLIECVFVGSVVSFISKKDSGKDTNIVDSWRVGLYNSWPLFCAIFIFQLSVTTAVLVFIIPALALTYYVMFFPFTTIVDGYKNVDALIASYVLVRGAWWRTLGYYLGLIVMFMALEISFVICFMVFALLFGVLIAVLHITYLVSLVCAIVVLITVALALITFAVSMSAHYIYAYYKSLKVRKQSTFEGEFVAVRQKARQFFAVTAGIGFVLIVAFYVSGLYVKYINFIQKLQTEQLQQEAQRKNSHNSSFDQMGDFGDTTTSHFK